VMATLGVFIALGGVSYAAIELPKNSVGTKQLKDGAVTPAKLAKPVKKSLTKAGTPGAPGPAGAPGAPGAPGAARAYALIKEGGQLDLAHSKGIIAIGQSCDGGVECTSPPPIGEEAPYEYCFNLGFEPAAVTVTPRMGASYLDQAANRWDAAIPGRTWTSIRGGCPLGYRDASVRVWREVIVESEGSIETEKYPSYQGAWIVFY
jgi:hypothetical protein